ncbi:zinc finger C2HC domain-containing protein 1A-like [Antedon mediterranea]|uniref:zinc finger C2HC domain-containing protein 1A-like n=1 Tax=Antedon mediterranea TaxID=105859 RepID=UPI003AF7DFBE
MNEALIPCSNCGRTFAQSRVSKHQNICRKSSKRRPTFDSGKQRAEGTDIPFSVTKRTRQKNGITKTNWRQRHQEFISAIRNARKAVLAVRTGQPLPPPPPPADNPDYITCRSCYRRFNAQAAARHIPVCTNRRKELGEPVSFAFRTVPGDYGSKNYYAKQYAKTVPKPSVKSSISRRNLTDVSHEDESVWPFSMNGNMSSNSSIFPYNGCSTSSERRYQDQPNVLTNTGLSPVMLSGNRYKQYQRPSPGFAVAPRLRLPKKPVPQPQGSRSMSGSSVIRYNIQRGGHPQLSRSLPTPTITTPRSRCKISKNSSDDAFQEGRPKSRLPARRERLLSAREPHNEGPRIVYTFGNMQVYED